MALAFIVYNMIDCQPDCSFSFVIGLGKDTFLIQWQKKNYSLQAGETR